MRPRGVARKCTVGIPDTRRRHQVRVDDRVRDRTVDVTRRSNGARLVPSWRGRCTEALCDEDHKLVLSPQLIGGQISGNGRYAVFSANFGKPGRIDLYLKNLRTGDHGLVAIRWLP